MARRWTVESFIMIFTLFKSIQHIMHVISLKIFVSLYFWLSYKNIQMGPKKEIKKEVVEEPPKPVEPEIPPH